MKLSVRKIVVAGLFLCLSLLAQPRQALGEPADTAQIERLIRQLGSERFAEREAAGKALDAIGEPALPALRKAQGSSDLEIRRRVAALLKSIARQRALARAKAWTAIEKFGGDMQSKDGTPDGITGCVDFHSRPVGDVEAVVLPWLDDALSLNLGGSRITDNALAYIETFYRLEVLTLAGTAVTDTGLKHIEKLTTLHWLELAGTQVTGTGLVHLKKLTKLTSLDLGRTPITDAGLEHVKEFQGSSNIETLRHPSYRRGVSKTEETPEIGLSGSL